MPGSNEYSINPELKTGASTEQLTKAPVPGNPVLLPYKPRNFEEVKAREMYGTEMDRRDNRRFKRYLKSAQGMVDAAHFEASEKARAQAANDYATQQNVARLQAKNPISTTPISAPVKVAEVTPRTEIKPSSVQRIKPTIDWNAIAQQNGFSDMEAVRQWQLKNGLVADGKFGKNSKAKWDSLQQQSPKLVSRQIDNAFDETPIDVINKSSNIQETSDTVSNTSLPYITEEQFRNHKNFRNIYGAPKNHTITIEGKKYPVMATTGLFGNNWGLENDAVYAFDPDTGMIRQVREGVLFGGPSAVGGYKFASGSEWSNALSGMVAEEEWLRTNPAPNKRGSLGGTYTQEYNDWFKKYQTARAGWKKQGGTMNRINYFQQGGAAPQQDIKTQITALVQAAMQGDQKATQQVNQIMEAAKAGDKQAMQIAQIMEQVVKELQGQATSAKWGAKLGYIRSLKYAKGGKTCPACKNGGMPETADKAYIKATKKVEEKACGGKAKKKYFGGLI